jgi:predicted AAA+ superfamily ATPase
LETSKRRLSGKGLFPYHSAVLIAITAEKEETIKVGNKIVQIVPLWKWLLLDKV